MDGLLSSTDLMKQRVGTLISGSFILTGHRPKPDYHLRLTGPDVGHRVRIKGAVLTRSRVSFPPGVVVVLYCVCLFEVYLLLDQFFLYQPQSAGIVRVFSFLSLLYSLPIRAGEEAGVFGDVSFPPISTLQPPQ